MTMTGDTQRPGAAVFSEMGDRVRGVAELATALAMIIEHGAAGFGLDKKACAGAHRVAELLKAEASSVATGWEEAFKLHNASSPEEPKA
jgi:hypothetical protein